VAPNCRIGKRGTGKSKTELQDLKMWDWKTWHWTTGLESVGLENARWIGYGKLIKPKQPTHFHTLI